MVKIISWTIGNFFFLIRMFHFTLPSPHPPIFLVEVRVESEPPLQNKVQRVDFVRVSLKSVVSVVWSSRWVYVCMSVSVYDDSKLCWFLWKQQLPNNSSKPLYPWDGQSQKHKCFQTENVFGYQCIIWVTKMQVWRLQNYNETQKTVKNKNNKIIKVIALTLSLPDHICNSPYCQPYNSYNVSYENLELDQLTIPKLIFFFILIIYLVDISLIL